MEEIGAIYRGENMQITTYLEKAFKSELSGNCRRPLPGRRADPPSR